jgi:hypothetical protein
MKETQSILNSLVACGVALAMVSTLAAQSGDQSAAKVVRLKGAVRYSTGNNVWQPLKLGDVVRPGTAIQTAADSRVDLVLGDASAPVARPMPSDMISYQPMAEQNVVRLWENTLMGVDKLTEMRTGEAVVTETALDLKAGHITGSVKKMSAASKYEVKLPNGVAGIKGTIYECYAEGVIKVREGSIVVAYPGANGAIVTQVIMSMQMFDIRTGILSPLPDIDKTGMDGIIKELQAGLMVVPGELNPAGLKGLKPPDVNAIGLMVYIAPQAIPVQPTPPPPVSPH